MIYDAVREGLDAKYIKLLNINTIFKYDSYTMEKQMCSSSGISQYVIYSL